MYLIDTNVISEIRKLDNCNKGVKSFFTQAEQQSTSLFLSVITIGELRRGVDMIYHRGDIKQAELLESWLTTIVENFADNIIEFTAIDAMIWGRLRVPNHENAIDKLIAATALRHELTLVTRNVKDFDNTGVKTLNPFT